MTEKLKPMRTDREKLGILLAAWEKKPNIMLSCAGANTTGVVAKWIKDALVGVPAQGTTDGDQLCIARADIALLSNAMREACEFLMETKYGSPARSPGHNARVRLERALELVGVVPAEGEPASASDLVKIAAELHRAKWQFDLQDETRLTMSEARQLVIRAFEQMHRIGDMALKMRDAAKSQSPAEKASDDYNQGYNAGVEWATKQYSQPERVELPADGSPPAWCCKGAAPAAACRCAIEEGELVRLRAQVERLTAAVSGLFAGGFIEAGVRESDQWSQELDVRIGHLKSALPSTEKK